MDEQPGPPEPEKTDDGNVICPGCNRELAPSAVFCVKCGHHLEHGAAITTVPSSGSRWRQWFGKLLRK